MPDESQGKHFDIRSGYLLYDGSNTIANPGKFEGEMRYVPHMYDDSLEGCWEQDGSVVWSFIDETDIKQWPELEGKEGNVIALEEFDNGFIVSKIYESIEALKKEIGEFDPYIKGTTRYYDDVRKIYTKEFLKPKQRNEIDYEKEKRYGK